MENHKDITPWLTLSKEGSSLFPVLDKTSLELRPDVIGAAGGQPQ